MQTIEDEIIGELRYLTVEFDQTELVTGGMGVISQDAVKRYFIEKCPDLKVKKCGGLKLDSQRSIVTMRIGIVNNQPEKLVGVNPIVTDTSPGYVGQGQKLLQPGYDELKAKYDAIVEAAMKDAMKFTDLLVENKELKKEVSMLRSTWVPPEDGPFSESAPTAEEVTACAVEILQDSADLAEAKKAIAEDDSIGLDAFEDEIDE